MEPVLSATPRKEGTWTKLVIFVALYMLLLESILEWVLVLYLYGNGQVDSKMTLSVVLALVASFFSVPLVSLQSLVAWQYNNIGGFGTQKTILHNVCTYVLRLDLMLWLATSVAGLVVAAQQVYCLPEGTDASFWRVGISCAFHRASVIVSVVSMVTVCTMYCARELCDRPYDVSLFGIYKRPQINRDGSIVSGNSWDSDETLKTEILYLCRQHDGNGTGEFWSVDPIANRVNCHPTIRHPAPIRLRPQLRVNTDPGSTYGEIVSGTTISPDSPHRISPGSQSLASDYYPISRTSTIMTSQTAVNELRALFSDGTAPKVPQIPQEYTSHTRSKSSLSSLRRLLPKSLPLSLPLSADPQIQALTDPNAASDIEKQVVTPNSMPKGIPESTTYQLVPNGNTPNASSASLPQSPVNPQPNPKPARPEVHHTRTMTMNSADAPEVVPPAPSSPQKFRRSQTAYDTPSARSINHPHHPNFISRPRSQQRQRAYCQSRRQAPSPQMHPDSMRKNMLPQQNNDTQYPIRSSSYHFDPNYRPRHSQSQYNLHPGSQYGSQSSRWANQRRYNSSRSMHAPIPRRNDAEVIYPSARRSRSSTHASASGPLSCILETTSDPHVMDGPRPVSVACLELPSNCIDQSRYRSANRSSLSFY
ncbi:uncharacterized protein N7479_005942 [Penicillium vulpinum]|uniref:Uncharacterized protein n=1 Tax=Penicillium vulpinum TaxID=29845 RepID=A0A1V6SEI1_9EURO|nr:uncharacterized protein N7479_005942 [Penicillium vulpinum]KAJ5958792.1 hypothetical protein N7479_005942 [Penicillium vulpinum]OQE12200.1 hypothetical protein PENVUL_c001G05546 [Penicillium vulpinum]